MTYTVLQQSGVWINDPGAINPDTLGPKMQAHKVRWVCPLIQEGFDVLHQTEYVNKSWWRRLDQTPRVIRLGWVNDTHGVGEDVNRFCALTSDLVNQYGLQGVMFDLEAAWKAGPDLPADEQTRRWQRWDRFLKEWRRLRPGLLTVLSTFAYPPYVPFPWKNIASAKVRFAPQNLYQYAEYYRCAYSISGAKQVGYPKSYVHFMLSREEGHTLERGIHDAHAAKQAGGFSGGISVYLAETMTDADWELMRFAADSGLSKWNP